MNLTEKLIAKLVPGKKRAQYPDKDVTGFGVRVEPNGRKSYYWYAKVRGVPRFRALGEFNVTPLKDARDEARKLAGIGSTWKQSGYAGDDPFEKKESAKPASVPTFGELVNAYVA